MLKSKQLIQNMKTFADVQTEIIPLDRTDGEGRENTEDGDETKGKACMLSSPLMQLS